MQKSIILALSLLTIALPTSAIFLASAPAVAQTRPAKLKTHTIGAVTFKTPSNWIDKSSAADDLVLHNSKPPKLGGGWSPKGSIKVIAQILAQDLKSAVARQPNGREMGTVAEKTEQLTIGGQSAIRIHQIHDDGFPASIVTFIATGDNQTIMIATFYSDKPTEQQVKQIHQTIRIPQ
jgi:hypothetical protein